jgi:hypothetical protein
VVPSLQPREEPKQWHPSAAYGLKVAGMEAPFAEEPPGDGPSSRPAAGSEDPILTTKRRFDLPVPTDARARRRVQFLNEILPRIAETYEIDLIADAYWQRRPLPTPPPSTEERPLLAVLNDYVLPGARWTREGAFIHVRRHAWYDDRLREIPERFVRQWPSRLREQSQLSLEDAAAISLALRDEQIESFEAVMNEQGIRFTDGDPADDSFYGGNLVGKREILRAYGSLSPDQQQSLRSGRALAGATLPLPARAWIQRAAARRLRLPVEPARRWSYGPPSGVPPGTMPATLSLSVTTVGRDPVGEKSATRASFTVRYPRDGAQQFFSVTLPRVEVAPAARDQRGDRPLVPRSAFTPPSALGAGP